MDENMADLVKTGIDGLDAMLYGGVPKENQILLAGGPGAGKTLMAFEYIYKNAKMGNTGVFFALEENPAKVVQNAKEAFPEFTDIDELIGSGKLAVEGKSLMDMMFNKFEQPNFEFGRIISETEDTLVKSKATCAVVDSLSALQVIIKDPNDYRRALWSLTANFRRLGVTSILTSEIRSPDRSKLKFRPEHFIFDGMLVMYQSGEESKRIMAMEIIKMRGRRHSFVTAPYDITPNGFKVFSPELMST